jgi:hypothetical protein
MSSGAAALPPVCSSQTRKGSRLRAGFDCKVTAGFLESGRVIANAGNTAALIAGIGCWSSQGIVGVLLGVSLAAWLLESWFAVRVAIDRSLFHSLAGEPADGADWLDALLVDWKLLKRAQSRSMPDRSRGALQLLRLQVAALAVQLAALALALVLHVVTR